MAVNSMSSMLRETGKHLVRCVIKEAVVVVVDTIHVVVVVMAEGDILEVEVAAEAEARVVEEVRHVQDLEAEDEAHPDHEVPDVLLHQKPRQLKVHETQDPSPDHHGSPSLDPNLRETLVLDPSHQDVPDLHLIKTNKEVTW